jgi:hypothetical protein
LGPTLLRGDGVVGHPLISKEAWGEFCVFDGCCANETQSNGFIQACSTQHFRLISTVYLYLGGNVLELKTKEKAPDAAFPVLEHDGLALAAKGTTTIPQFN